MKKRETDKSVSGVKSKKEKRWKIFSKENLKWGLGSIIVFSLVAVVLLNLPCKLIGGVFPFCLSMISFALINFLGLIISNKILNLYGSAHYYTFAIILSAPLYYFIGLVFRRVISKFKK